MPIDLSSLVEFLQRGVASIPPVVIAIFLLAGPTAALIGYRLIGYRVIDAARRMQALKEVVVEPLWICQDCRSANELRLSRCYRCGYDRDAADQVELVVDHRTATPTFFEVPAGSPFATIGTTTSGGSAEDSGTPVMVDPAIPSDTTAVESDRPVDAAGRAPFVGAVQGRATSLTVEAGEAASRSDLASALWRRT